MPFIIFIPLEIVMLICCSCHTWIVMRSRHHCKLVQSMPYYTHAISGRFKLEVYSQS